MSTIQGNRRRLHEMANSEFIEPGEFLSRAISRQSLVRVDDPAAAVHGLFDPDTGARYFVEDEKFHHPQTVSL